MKYIIQAALLMVTVVILIYVSTYALFRHTHLYVHYTGSYRDGVRHSIHAGRAAPGISIPASFLLCLHYPLKISEEIYWNRDRLSSYFQNGFD